jgi:hypothetical protein
MKKILSLSTIFSAAFLLFAQDEGVNLPAPNNDVSEQVLQIDNDFPQENVEEQETQPQNAVVHDIFFVGLQTGDIPELRDRFEDMIRLRWGTESNVRFVSKEQTQRIRRRAFSDKAVEASPAFFNELRKHGLENSIVLFIFIEEHSIKPVRRLLFAGRVEGRLGARLLFYDAAQEKAMLVTRTSSVSQIKKGFIGFKSPTERVHITASDKMKINAELLEDAVTNGFGMMKIAVSLKNNTK